MLIRATILAACLMACVDTSRDDAQVRREPLSVEQAASFTQGTQVVQSGDTLAVLIAEAPLSASELATSAAGQKIGRPWTRLDMPVPTMEERTLDLATQPDLRFAQEWVTEDPFTGEPTTAIITLDGREPGLTGSVWLEPSEGADQTDVLMVSYHVLFVGRKPFIDGTTPLPVHFDAANRAVLVSE